MNTNVTANQNSKENGNHNTGIYITDTGSNFRNTLLHQNVQKNNFSTFPANNTMPTEW